MSRSVRRAGGSRATAGLAVATLSALTLSPTQPAAAGVVQFNDAELIDARLEGIVFVDYDRDGRVDPGEDRGPAVSGRQITVASTNREERTRSGDDGRFALDLPNLVALDGIETGVRVEIDTPDGHVAGLDSPSVRHVRVRDGDVIEFLVAVVPESRCPDDPAEVGDPSGRFPDGNPHSVNGKLWTACFVDGAAESTEGAQDVLVAANVDATEWEPPNADGFGGHLDVEHLATKQQMGAIWGLAHDEWDGVIWASAVVKRHSDLGPAGIDGLYWRSSDAQQPSIRSIDLDDLSPDGAPSFGTDPVDCPRTPDGVAYDYDAWTFESTAPGGSWDCRDLDLGGGGSESFDWWAYDRVGRDGIGDIDLTPDGDRLVVVNATADAVFVYDVESVDDDVAFDAGPIYVAHHDVVVPECVRGRSEVWGVKVIDADTAYVGTTCTAETSGSIDDLVSRVVRLDIGDGSSETVVALAHDHPHGPGYVVDAAPGAGRFRPWFGRDELGRPVMPPLEEAVSIGFRDFLDAYGYSNSFDWHQPLLSDIEVDPLDGSLTLAVMDRWPMMTGVFNCDLDPSDGGCGYSFPAPPAGDYDGVAGDDPVAPYTGGVIAYVAGDLVRACNVSDDVVAPRFVIEGGQGCDPSGFSPRFTEPFGGGPAGPYEWYWNDQAFTGVSTDNPHPEAAQGAVAQLPRRDDVVYTAMNATETFGAGLSRDAHVDGSHVAGIQFFRTDFEAGDGTGWKSAGLGDVEGCAVPIAVGDHVWFDESADGVRDPDEPPIVGVSVALLDGSTGDAIAETITGPDGDWGFDSTDGLVPLGDYVLRFTVGDDVRVGELAAADLVPTRFRTVDARSDLDSDLPTTTDPDRPYDVRFRAGPAGQSDHTIDAGFADIAAIGGAPIDEGEVRPGPPWQTLGILFGGIVLVGGALVIVLRRFVW